MGRKRVLFFSVALVRFSPSALTLHAHTTNNTDSTPGKNDNLSGGKHINFPEAFLQNDSGVKVKLK
jgi:hypothetical protein